MVDITREQPTNIVSTNLLEDLCLYLTVLSRLPCRTSTEAACKVSSTILEVLQGPCKGNQSFLAMNTDLLETMNRIMRAKCPIDGFIENEYELKTIIIDVFRALLEGQSKKSAVFDRVISVLHFDIIQNLCYPIKVEEDTDSNDGTSTIHMNTYMSFKI